MWKWKSRRNQLGASAHAGPDVWSGSVCIQRETNLHEPRAKQNTSDLVLELHVLALGTALLKKLKLFECSNKKSAAVRKETCYRWASERLVMQYVGKTDKSYGHFSAPLNLQYDLSHAKIMHRKWLIFPLNLSTKMRKTIKNDLEIEI